MRGLVKAYADIGLVMDSACTDWTRLFRAPKVTREKVRTWRMPWFFFRPSDEATDADAIDPVTKVETYRDRYAKPEPITSAKPTPEQAHARLYESGSRGRAKLSAMHRQAKRLLRGTDVYGPCFGDAPIAEEGSRDETLLKLVGSAITRLLLPNASEFEFEPEDVYALFLGPVQQLEPDAGTPDWSESLWSKITRIYAQERAKLAAEQAEQEARAEELAEVARAMDPSLPLLLTRGGGSVFVRIYGTDFYLRRDVVTTALVNTCRTEAGWPDEMLTVASAKSVRTIRAGELCDRHLSMVDEVVVRGVPKVLPGAFVERDEARGKRTLVVPTHGARVLLDDWPELPREQFDTALSYTRALVGEEHLDHFLDALAAQVIDTERTCAIALEGPPAAGKDMIGESHERLFGGKVELSALLPGNFSDEVVDCGFVWDNEGGLNDPALPAAFRRFMGGMSWTAHIKYRAPMQIQRPGRMLISANDSQTVSQMFRGSSNDTRDAIDATSVRLARFRARQEGVEFLAKLGGMQHTNAPGREWVGGDPHIGGARFPRFMLDLARMHLDGRRPITHGDPRGRFLVRGTDIAQQLDLVARGESGAKIMAAVVAQLERRNHPASGELAVEVSPGQGVLVNPHSLAERMKADPDERRPVTATRIATYLRGVATGGRGSSGSQDVRMPCDRRRAYSLTAERLMEVLDLLDLDVEPSRTSALAQLLSPSQGTK